MDRLRGLRFMTERFVQKILESVDSHARNFVVIVTWFTYQKEWPWKETSKPWKDDLDYYEYRARKYGLYHGLTNREIGEAKKVTKFEVNPANLSGFWREI